MLRQRPALRFALLLTGGILAAREIVVVPAAVLCVLVALFVLILLVRHRLFSDVLLQLCVVLLGVLLAGMEEEQLRTRRLPSEMEGDTVKACGVLAEDPVIQGKVIRTELEADSVLSMRPIAVSERHLILYASLRQFASQQPHWSAGERVSVTGVVEQFPQARNPGEFDYGRYLALNDIDGILWVTDSVALEGPMGLPGPRIWFTRLRGRFSRVLEELHGPLQAGFLRGILLGDRSGIPTDVKQSFVNTGTVHILAVSGAHGAVIAAALYVFLGLLRFSRRWVILLTMAGLFFYMMLTGASASIVRATLMTSVVLSGRLIERKTDIYNSIAVAALVILLWSPSQLLNVGFQLSFAAVLSIVSIYPRLSLLIQKIPPRFEEIKAVDFILKLFAVSFAAQLGTLPFTAYYFGRFSIVSLAANLVVVPMVGVNLVLGSVTLIVSTFSTWAAASYAALNNMLVTFLLGFVKASASVPYAYVETGGFSFGAAVLYYLGLAGLLTINKPVAVKRLAGALLVYLNLVLVGSLSSPGLSLAITVLDVGQGDALVIRFPNGRLMLVDAGPKTLTDDAGKRVVVPYLERQGITRISALVASHPHSDHIGGIPFLLTRIRVDTVFEADTLTASALHRRMREQIGEEAIAWRQTDVGQEISPDPSVRVYILGPPHVSTGSNLNNRSIVLKVVYGRTAAVLPGDAEDEEEESILSRYGSFLQAGLLKAGHHGSSTSSTAEFLHGMNPDFAIISVGVRNKFRHPSPTVIQRMSAMGIEVERTDREGAVVFESDGSSWKRIAWRTERP